MYRGNARLCHPKEERLQKKDRVDGFEMVADDVERTAILCRFGAIFYLSSITCGLAVRDLHVLGSLHTLRNSFTYAEGLHGIDVIIRSRNSVQHRLSLPRSHISCIKRSHRAYCRQRYQRV